VPALMHKAKKQTKVFWSVFDPLSLVDNKRPGLITQKYKWFTYVLKLHNLYDSRLIRKIDRVIVPTQKMKKQLDSFYQINSTVLPTAGVRSEEKATKHISLIEKRLKKKFSFTKNNQIILFSNGHFLPHRRYEDVLHALPDLIKKGHNITYIISGSNKFDAVYFEKIASLVKKLNLSDNVFLDAEFKSNDEILGYYQYSDIFLFVSVEQTWGLAPFEAMLCQKPVIISKGVGCSEVLTDKSDALIVDERSPKQITKSIEYLIKNKEIAKQISKKGYKTTLDNFTYREIAKKIAHLVD